MHDEGRGGQSNVRSNIVMCSICKQFDHNRKDCQLDATAMEKVCMVWCCLLFLEFVLLLTFTLGVFL